jgi:hypothetical protein
MKYTINELANSKGVSQPVREALLQMEAELDATNRQVEILSDALAESRRKVAAQPAPVQMAHIVGEIDHAGKVWKPVQNIEHCEAGPEFCPVCRAETRSLALAAAVGYIQRNTPPLVWTEICRALDKSPPAAQRQWVGLTDDDVRKINQEVWGYVSADHARMRAYARAIEAKLKEKNT